MSFSVFGLSVFCVFYRSALENLIIACTSLFTRCHGIWLHTRWTKNCSTVYSCCSSVSSYYHYCTHCTRSGVWTQKTKQHLSLQLSLTAYSMNLWPWEKP